ncbi:TetR/AcrR family transcriptional regulator [Streptomyces sp. BE133]|uniref:TetR/AcrR family transcriptional regulator n=1 Tax=Streptomyces sp. BE133 TaxID=3002523 RepID=UPI002E7DEDB8|nr:hypothetical protein [Streptomyces sp. BE133]
MPADIPAPTATTDEAPHPRFAVGDSALPALVMRGVPVSETGAANGLNTLMRSIGQAFCSATVAAVLAHITFLVGGRTAPTLHAYQVVFLIAAGAALAALLVTLCLPGGRTPTPGTVEECAARRAFTQRPCPESTLRAELIAGHLLGLGATLSLHREGAGADATPEHIADLYAPALQTLIAG